MDPLRPLLGSTVVCAPPVLWEMHARFPNGKEVCKGCSLPFPFAKAKTFETNHPS